MRTLARACYRCLPAPLREAMTSSSVIKRFADRCAAHPLVHDFFYDARYYDSQLAWLDQAAEAFADTALELEGVRSVVDVGCGQGHYLEAFRRRGVRAAGVECSREAVRRCQARQLLVIRADLRKLPRLPMHADLVYSIEVAEHLPADMAEHFVDLLTAAADRWLVITAAAPGQTGMNHFNCQPPAYWIDRIEARAMRYRVDLTLDWRQRHADASLPAWLCENLMVFERA